MLNLVALKQGKDSCAAQSVLTRADTAAIEIARRTVDPGFSLDPEIAGTPSLVDVDAGDYLEAVDEHGSPAYTPAELVAAPHERPPPGGCRPLTGAADLDATATRPGRTAGGRRRLHSGRPGPSQPEVRLAPGATRIEVAARRTAAISLRRFAVGEYPVVTEAAPGGSATLLRIPPEARRPGPGTCASKRPAGPRLSLSGLELLGDSRRFAV